MINLLEDEKIIIEQRRHWIVVLYQSFALIAAIIVPLLIIFSLSAIEPIQVLFFGNIKSITGLLFILISWKFCIFTIFFIVWTNYYLDVIVVTNKRLIDVEQRGLFARDQTSIPIKNIQDIKIEIIGFLPSLLKFGHIHVQTAGQIKELLIKNLPNPIKIKDIILNLISY
ncbi:MAG: PH domain-containing protein [Candidatus Liptonbacteria bacterium]|nr:PH domain-containing protein [Candidatus Liptonbacteria bacterium]